MKQNRIKVFGPPGTGKTTWCLETLGHHLDAGDKVLFVSFTRAAADEGKTRLRAKFGDIPPYATCSTLHSLCLRILNIPKDCLFDQFSTQAKFWQTVEHMGMSNTRIGRTLSLYQRLRNEERYSPDPNNAAWFDDMFESNGLKTFFIGQYEQFKQHEACVDFTDLLSRVANGEGTIPDYDVVIIDEAQDLTTLQWRVMERICAKTPHTVYAVGDDDQSIYEFMGADVGYFLSWPCTSIQVLNHTYRLPQNFLDYSQHIALRISERQGKQIRTDINGLGALSQGFVTDNLPFYRYPSELYLVRNNYMLDRIKQHLVQFGFPFKGKTSPWMRGDVQSIGTTLAWRQETLDRTGWRKLKRYMSDEFIKRIEETFPAITERNSDFVLPSLGSLFKPRFFEDDRFWWRKLHTKMESQLRLMVMNGFYTYSPEQCLNPTLELSTIHGAKGKEADCVYICSALTDRIQETLLTTDFEHRLFYVGVTRAKKELMLLTDHRLKEHYPFPQL